MGLCTVYSTYNIYKITNDLEYHFKTNPDSNQLKTDMKSTSLERDSLKYAKRSELVVSTTDLIPHPHIEELKMLPIQIVLGT